MSSSTTSGGGLPSASPGGTKVDPFEVFFVATETKSQGHSSGGGGQQIKITVSVPYGPAVVTTKWANVLKFAFPGSQQVTTEDDTSFTFVLTDDTGFRMYGHTTRSVNGHAYVFLSKFPWCRFFYHMIGVFQANHEDITLIQKLHSCPMPEANGLFELPSTDPFAEEFNSLHLQRPNDYEFAYVDTWPHELLEVFTFDQIFQIMSAMLTEAQIAVVGNNFPIVSRMCLSLLALTYPFQWQHVLVPVIPRDLLDVLSAPTPFLVGFIRSQVDHVEKMPISDQLVLVTVAEDGRSVQITGGISSIPRLPKSSWASTLRRQVQMWYYSPKQVKLRKKQVTQLQSREKQEADLRGLLPIFMQYYGELFGGIGGECRYDPAGFLKKFGTKDNREFMQAMVTTQAFDTLRIQTLRLFESDDLWTRDGFCRLSVQYHPKEYPQLISRIPALKTGLAKGIHMLGSVCGSPARDEEVELRPREPDFL